MSDNWWTRCESSTPNYELEADNILEENPTEITVSTEQANYNRLHSPAHYWWTKKL